jgi:hypothetical protein
VEQQINKKKEEGPLKPKTVHGQWKEVCPRNKTIFCNYKTYVSSAQTIHTGLLEDGANNSYQLREVNWHVERQICGHPYNATSEQQ